MLIVRDKVGQRPLFYLHANSNLIFASEIRAILQVNGFKREIDPTALDYFLFFSYIPSPFTIFKGIKKLSPSCFINCDLNGKDFEIKQYWDPSFKVNHSLDEDAWAQIIYNNLVNSTKMMLQKCKGPIGVLLSGGIDSSIIAAILRKLVDEDAEIAAFTSSFSDAEYNETFYAKKVAEHLNLDHYIQVIEPDHVSKSLPTLAWFFEEPFGGNAVAHFLNMKFARAFTNEVFNGDGGDEAFYYPFFQEPRILNYCRRFRCLEKVLSLRITSRIAEKLTNIPSECLSIKKSNLLEHLILERISFFSFQPLELKKSFGRSQLKGILDFVRSYIDKAKNLQAEDFSSILSYVCFRTRLPDCMIRMTYCTSSAASMKVKSPFLDVKFMDVAFSIPSKLKLRNGKAKYILIKMARKFDLLPREVIDRKKMGFPVPFERWLRRDLNYLIPQMAESEAVKKHVNLNYVSKLIKMFESSAGSNLRYPYAYFLWALIMFWQWYEAYIECRCRS
jgi:asparagine synthase (glutamine-hydrolysing)